jgi:hypothetical protein
VELVSGTSADWISLSALYTLTEDVEANKKTILGLQTKAETLTKANAEAVIDKEASALKVRKGEKGGEERLKYIKREKRNNKQSRRPWGSSHSSTTCGTTWTSWSRTSRITWYSSLSPSPSQFLPSHSPPSLSL